MTKYRKKPVVIEAQQWDGTASNAGPVIDWVLDGGGSATYYCGDFYCSGKTDDHTIVIRTLEGDMTVSADDFVIRGVKGEFYPCKPDIFEATYEAVGE